MHSLGPWEWRGNQLWSPTEQQTLLRDVTFWNLKSGDKALIAAAPDLLFEIQRLHFFVLTIVDQIDIDAAETIITVNVLSETGKSEVAQKSLLEVLENVSAAIAKAEGRAVSTHNRGSQE